MEKIKAFVMLSGGLDSLLAARLLQEQGIEVVGINFSSPFFGNKNAIEGAKQLGIKLVSVNLGKDYIAMLKKPKHGYGTAMNPCIDCHAFMLRKAKKLMKEYNISFIATGEVLNERPMSQNLKALEIVENESGLKGKLLRPLSAKLLPETETEKKKLADRIKLMDINGRSRQIQMQLAEKYKLKYPSPAGGCLLCEKEFSIKLKDLLKNKKEITAEDIELLKIGRHFRTDGAKIIVGRNHEENIKIMKLAKENYTFEVKDTPSPITLVIGKINDSIIKTAAALTMRYSDAEEGIVNYGKGKFNKKIESRAIDDKEIEKLRLK